MAGESPQALIERYWAGFSSKDIAAAVACFADDVVYEDTVVGHVAKGKAEVAAFWTAWFEAAAESFEANLENSVVTPDGYAIEWVMRGRFNGSFGALQGSGPFEFRGSSVGSIANGLITSNRDYWNLAALLAQLGITELPPA